MATAVKRNVCLIVIDGWGISEETKGMQYSNDQTQLLKYRALIT